MATPMPNSPAFRHYSGSPPPPPSSPPGSNTPPPPPPTTANQFDKRGILLKEETRLGIKSWSKKYVVATKHDLKYYASPSVPPITEAPRKTLGIETIVVEKVPVASKHYREFSFRVICSPKGGSSGGEGGYAITFSAESGEERDEWMSFLTQVGGGRSKRLDTLIENEIVHIKEESQRDLGIYNRGQPPRPDPRLPPSPSQKLRISAAPPLDIAPSASRSQRRIVAARVYDLFIKPPDPAVRINNLPKLTLHLGLADAPGPLHLPEILDPGKTGYIAKDLFLRWVEEVERAGDAQDMTEIERESDLAPERLQPQRAPTPPAPLNTFPLPPPSKRPPPPQQAPLPTLDLATTMNLLKFTSTKPLALHMLVTTLTKAVNTTIMNPGYHTAAGTPVSFAPLIRTLTALFTKTYTAYAARLAFELQDDGDEFGGFKEDYGEEAMEAILCLTLRLVKRCAVSGENAGAIFEGTGEEGGRDFQYFLSSCLEKASETKYTKLRVHSAKLLLHLATAHPFTIPLYNIRSIVAVAGAAADNLRTVCLELLRRLLPWRTESVAHCNGVKTMCDAILDPLQKDMAEPLMLAILHVFSNPAARKFMRSHRDFNGLFAAFTDLDVVVGAERSGKWKRSSVALITILRSYTGIILLATDPNGLKGIMNLISDDTVDSATQNAVLAFIKDVFAPCLQTANGGKAADAGDSTHSTMQSPVRGSLSPARMSIHNKSLEEHTGKKLDVNVLDCYSSILCCAFIHCGFVRSLTNLCVHDDIGIANEALTLLSSVMVVASRLLPESYCNGMLTMPELTYCATIVSGSEGAKVTKGLDKRVVVEGEGGKEEEGEEGKGLMPLTAAAGFGKQKQMLKILERGTKASAALDSLAMALGENDRGAVEDESSGRANSIGGVVGILRSSNLITKASVDENNFSTRRERMMEGLKHALETGLDKTMLEDQLKKSKVLTDKDWLKWDWETIREILEDSLENSARLSEALKGKFIKRLGGYFRCDPGEKGFFAHLEWTPKNILYMNCACRFYTVLLSHNEGRNFLKGDRRGKVFEEITQELQSVLENARDDSPQNSSLVFHRDNAHRYMTREYFAILGRMWSTRGGKALSTLVNIFELFSELSKYQPLDYLSRVVLSNLDYNPNVKEGYNSTPGGDLVKSRFYLQTALENSKSVSLRLHIICVLRTIVRSRVKDFEWGLDILVTRLNFSEEDNDVKTAVLSVLNEAADFMPYLNYLITRRPTYINHPTAEVLFAKFALLESGIQFLKESQWFERNVGLWREQKMMDYVVGVENALASTLGGGDGSRGGGGSMRIPLHAKEAIMMQAQQDKLAGKELDLESLLRIPWTIDMLINQSRSPSAQGEEVVLDTRIDVFYCDSDFAKLDGGLDKNCVVITGTYVKPDGKQSLYKCSLQDVIHTSLSIGACPVKKTGQVGKPLKKWMLHGEGGGGDIRSSMGSPLSSPRFGRSRGESNASVESDLSSGYAKGGGGEAGQVDDVSSCDWTTCAFQGNKIQETKFNNGEDLRIVVQGEPAIFWFKVADPERDSFNTNNLYLSKVEYVITLDPRKNAVKLPTHLFGELGHTEDGCAVLEEFGVIDGLKEVVEGSSSWASAEEKEKKEKKKEADETSEEFRGALWSLASVCASNEGLSLVLEKFEEFIVNVCKHAFTHPDYSMRGTCLCLLRLICETEKGRELCKGMGWSCGGKGASPIPANFYDFFKNEEAAKVGSGKGGNVGFVGSPIKACAGGGDKVWKKGGKEEKIFGAIAKLGDHITLKEAKGVLKGLKDDKGMGTVWEDEAVREEIHRLLESYTFDLESRRFVRQLLLEI